MRFLVLAVVMALLGAAAPTAEGTLHPAGSKRRRRAQPNGPRRARAARRPGPPA